MEQPHLWDDIIVTTYWMWDARIQVGMWRPKCWSMYDT